PRCNSLAVDQAGADRERADRCDDEREACRPVDTVARQEMHATARAPGHQPIAVVLDLVNPVRALGRSGGRGGKARLDEARGPAGTQTQHGGEDRLLPAAELVLLSVAPPQDLCL